MPRLQLWNKNKTNDYGFIDRAVAEVINAGGTGVYVHKYIGTYTDDATASTGSGDLYIQDVLFLENRDRKYDTDIYELRGAYNVSEPDFDLTQFGMFMSNDNLSMTFHMNTCASLLGRRLMAGDVIELPHLRDDLLLGGGEAINRYFVVSDSGRPAEGYDPRWWPHLWRVKLTNITDSPEYRDILGTGETATDLRNILSTYSSEIQVSDKVMELANADVAYDSGYYEGGHLYVDEESDKPGIYFPGDGTAPNGISIVGSGSSFPLSCANGDYFLRTDFEPHRLFKKQGSRWTKISDDNKKAWSAANKLLTSFVNNDTITTNTDGTTQNVVAGLVQWKTSRVNTTTASVWSGVVSSSNAINILLTETGRNTGVFNGIVNLFDNENTEMPFGMAGDVGVVVSATGDQSAWPTGSFGQLVGGATCSGDCATGLGRGAHSVTSTLAVKDGGTVYAKYVDAADADGEKHGGEGSCRDSGLRMRGSEVPDSKADGDAFAFSRLTSVESEEFSEEI